MDATHIALEKQHRILDAAQGRFARFGFSKVTMDEIAEDVGLAKASLYYYYPAKEDVFRAVIRREQEEFLRQTRAILEQPIPASERLKRLVEQRVELANQLLNLSAPSAKFWQTMKPMLRDLFDSFAQEELQLLARILRDGKKNNEFSIGSPEKTAELLLHVLQGLRLRSTQAAQFQGETAIQFDTLKKETCQLVEVLLQGIIKRNDY